MPLGTTMASLLAAKLVALPSARPPSTSACGFCVSADRNRSALAPCSICVRRAVDEPVDMVNLVSVLGGRVGRCRRVDRVAHEDAAAYTAEVLCRGRRITCDHASEQDRPEQTAGGCLHSKPPSHDRHLDDHVRRLDHAHHFVALREREVIYRFGGHQADQPERTGADLDGGRHAILLDVRDYAGQPIASRRGGDRPARSVSPLAQAAGVPRRPGSGAGRRAIG